MDGEKVAKEILHCDAFYSCGKFRLKPAKLGENGRRNGYLNGESYLLTCRLRCLPSFVFMLFFF